MAKFRDQPITSTAIREYLDSQDDFALEMRICSLVSSLGYESSHGGTYEDPVTKKPRQYDVRAYHQSDDKRVDLAIECKSLKNSYPLVVSRVPRTNAESYHQVICSLERDGGPIYQPNLSPCETLQIEYRHSSSLYRPGEPVGKSTTQIGVSEKGDFVSGDAEVFDKWTQALSSLSELAGDAAWYRDHSEDGFFLTVLLPVLVIPDGTLWVADYDANGLLVAEPQAANETTIFMGRDFWRPMAGSYNVSHLHVCTVSGVTQLLSSIRSAPEMWETLFPMQEVLERLTET
jgi:hypothetical protein